MDKQFCWCRTVSGTLWAQRLPFVTQEGQIELFREYSDGDCHAQIAITEQLGCRFKLSFLITWKTVGYDFPGASDRTRTARLISELPSESFLQELQDFDQLRHWMALKDFAIQLAKCWEAGRGQPDNPLAWALEENLVTEWWHDYVWLSVDLYENLWRLIHLKARAIKAAFKKRWEHPFTSVPELLQEIVRSDIDSEFLNCLKPLFIEKANEISEITNIKRRQRRYFPLPIHANWQRLTLWVRMVQLVEWELLRKLVRQYSTPAIWYERLMEVTQALAERDTFVATRLKIHYELQDSLHKMQQRASCDPNLKRLGFQTSKTWEDGVKSEGINS